MRARNKDNKVMQRKIAKRLRITCSLMSGNLDQEVLAKYFVE